MPNRITQEERDNMREAWVESRSITGVATKCGVNWATAERYRVIDDWDGFAKKCDAATERRLIERIGKGRASKIAVADLAISKMFAHLKTKPVEEWNAADFDRLTRLIEFLLGGADSAADINIAVATKDIIRQSLAGLGIRDLQRVAGVGTDDADPEDPPSGVVAG